MSDCASIKLENVSWAYSRARDWALKNINLTIEEGECIAVMGENGAGKTTLCRLLNGLIPHSLPGKLIGTVTLDGIVTAACAISEISKKAGTVFEDPYTQLFTLAAGDEAAFALENLLLPPDEIKERVSWALGVTGLGGLADFPPASLSGGQKQRLAIAAALAMAEKILVLDEPASQLDPDGAHEVLSLIRSLRARKGLTVVMATNMPEEAAEFADRICVLKNGSLAACDTPQNIFADQKLLEDCALYSAKKNINCTANSNTICSTPVIEISRLSYEYTSGNTILNDINLTITENDFTAITGRNGCGKTTLLKNISGLLRPQQGKILLRGNDTAQMEIGQIAGEIGFVMQDPDRQLFESTVYDEVAFALKRAPRIRGPQGRALTRQTIREKTEEALSLVNLLDKRGDFPLALGRADRVKTVFAVILAMGPRIIMLDEPVAGQDAKGCRLIMELLSDLHGKGYTILLVTHNVRVIEEYAQKVYSI